MIITFIRHSLTEIRQEVNPIYWELLPEGIKRAQEFARNDYVNNVEIFFSSPQYKAIDTALILAKANRTQLFIEPGLNELTSITKGFINNYEATVKNLHLGKIKNINAGETIREGRSRFTATLGKIVAKNRQYKNIGIVSHCNIMSIFLSEYSAQNSHEIECSMQMPDVAIFDWEAKKILTNFNSATL